MASGHVVIIHTYGGVTVEDTVDGEPRLGQLQKAVGGYIEVPRGFEDVAFAGEILSRMSPADRTKLAPLGEAPVRCIAYCNEEGKNERLPLNLTASQLWAQAQIRAGTLKLRPDGLVDMADVLVGPVALLVGDRAIAEEEG